MELVHFSGEPFVFDPNYVYAPDRPKGYGKPVGLWLSDESDLGWRDWCTDNDWGTERLTHRAEFVLAPGANILHLSTPGQVYAFHKEYSVEPYPGAQYAMIPDWERVMEKYDGILITPYQWALRYEMDLLWYNGWDCASGCFWNLSAIQPVDQLVTDS